MCDLQSFFKKCVRSLVAPRGDRFQWRLAAWEGLGHASRAYLMLHSPPPTEVLVWTASGLRIQPTTQQEQITWGKNKIAECKFVWIVGKSMSRKMFFMRRTMAKRLTKRKETWMAISPELTKYQIWYRKVSQCYFRKNKLQTLKSQERKVTSYQVES